MCDCAIRFITARVRLFTCFYFSFSSVMSFSVKRGEHVVSFCVPKSMSSSSEGPQISSIFIQIILAAAAVVVMLSSEFSCLLRDTQVVGWMLLQFSPAGETLNEKTFIYSSPPWMLRVLSAEADVSMNDWLSHSEVNMNIVKKVKFWNQKEE